jgi:hypothetical protein
MLLFIKINLLAANLPELVNVRNVLEIAEEVVFQNGVTKTVATEPTGLGPRTVTTYYYKNEKNEKFTRRESKLVSESHITTTIVITRPDGNWLLGEGVAILEPEEMVRNQRDKNILHRDSKPIMGTIEECEEDGKRCDRVSFNLSADEKEKIFGVPQFASRQSDSAASIAVMKKMGDRTKRTVPHRYEYLICKDTGIIISFRVYSEIGNKIEEKKISTIVHDCEFILAKFEVPKDSMIIFPDTISEYISTLKKHMDIKPKNNAKTNKNNSK